ncbi:hypothetical protein [Paraburkholderia tropica]|uniref:hypothetical protein n=1 Tax=Paraburkholderia tropica TaxID=92647 RepID=UPI002AB5E550|nr:hypothetical protein [Paraburkholderia tropica]
MARLMPVWASILGVFIVVTSIYGGYHYFSPIPYWDQWDGYVGFYKQLQEGRFGVFWAQHMEHRIVFSRILFALDAKFFGGWNAFTVIMNYVLLVLVCWVIWREYDRGASKQHSSWLIGGLIGGFILAWCQSENLKWGFQSQGIAVYLFSFLAFAVYSHADQVSRRIVLAVLFAWLAVISMGNGIATFAVLIGQAILLRRSWKESLIFSIVGILAAAIYFLHYAKPLLPVDPSVVHIAFVPAKFFAVFLGSPFFYVFHSIEFSATMGVCYLVIACFAIGTMFFRRTVTPYRAFLAAIIAMVIVAALGAAHGRWMIGLESAVSSRYTTPPLMGYTALALLVLDMVKSRTARTLAALVPLITLTAIATYQSESYGSNQYLFEWKLALLGQKIGLDHLEYDAKLYPPTRHDNLIVSAEFAAADNLGPYGRGWLHDAGIVKFDASRVDSALCDGFMESISTDAVGRVAEGWAVARQFQESSLLIVLVNANGQTVGYGVTGRSRPDVKRANRAVPSDSGWVGFAQIGGPSLRGFVYVGGKFCPLNFIGH